ncbi:hypothetical protein XELAEV_18031488mg [Xenopus laevis]|uniref:Uncharacterized protein n=1 Tax=Xenopus laevis TaxID=8355 RepID=A0A974CMP3_XENLA|nr:hypothetical protein XELAEV_18031488mg [Xenopus laevis]
MGSTCAPSYANLYLGWWESRVASTKSEVEDKKLYVSFKERGYSPFSLKGAYKRAIDSDRQTLLTSNKRKVQSNTDGTKMIRLIEEYSAEHKKITNIISKHWHILQQDKQLKVTKPTWLTNKLKGCYRCGDCKTLREFCRRILEHVGDVKHKQNTSITNHINEHHNGNTRSNEIHYS